MFATLCKNGCSCMFLFNMPFFVTRELKTLGFVSPARSTRGEMAAIKNDLHFSSRRKTYLLAGSLWMVQVKIEQPFLLVFDVALFPRRFRDGMRKVGGAYD